MTSRPELVITIPLIPPSLNRTVRDEAIRRSLRPEDKKFRDDVILLCRGKKAPILAARLDVDLRIYLADRPWQWVPDVDNLPKLLLDGLKKAGVFQDDKFISDLAIHRRKTDTIRNERTVIRIREAYETIAGEEIY